MDPPVSSAMPAGAKSAATDVAEPLEEPPGAHSWFNALKVGPYAELLAFDPDPASTGRFVLPTMTAPASRSRETTAESFSGTSATPSAIGDVNAQPDVVGMPATSSESLITTGTPSSGPTSFFACVRRSS